MAKATTFTTYPASGAPPLFLHDTEYTFCLVGVAEFGFIEDGVVSKSELLDGS